MKDLTSFFQYIIIKVSSLIQTLYWSEDISSEQFPVVIEKIHYLTDGGMIAGLDFDKTKDI